MAARPIRRNPFAPYVANLAQDLVQALREQVRSQYGANATSQSVFGKSATLTSLGIDPLTNPTQRPQGNINLVSVAERGKPRQWVISMKGEIGEFGNVAAPVAVYPFTVFDVKWTIGGVSYQTQVDGYSDQFLSVYAEEVIVNATWDQLNFVRQHGLAVLTTPRSITMAASCTPQEGGTTLAKRSIFIDNEVAPSASSVPIPYAARSFIIRDATAAQQYLAATCRQLVSDDASFTCFVDIYTAADLLAAHSRGEALSVASTANFLVLNYAVQPLADMGLVEFWLQP